MRCRLIITLGVIIIALNLGTCVFVNQEPGSPSPAFSSGGNSASVSGHAVSNPVEPDPKIPTPLDLPGLPNAYRVTPTLYRGAQPTAEGMRQLKELGIRTVINLRSFHTDHDKIGDTGLGYEQIYMKAWRPEQEKAIRFLQIATDPSRQPVFVHCQHGADRTGMMIALYRITVQGWTREEAIEEMTEGPYGFHSIWQRLISFIRDLDIEDIKLRAGLE